MATIISKRVGVVLDRISCESPGNGTISAIKAEMPIAHPVPFAIDDKEAANRGQQLSLALSDMLKSKEPTYPVINDFWNSLQSGDRAKLRKALGIETVEGLISEFTVEDNIFTEEEFIEDINSCHL